MKDVFIVADNIISPLGVTTEENFTSLKKGLSGIKQQHSPALADDPFYASLLNETNNQHLWPVPSPATVTKGKRQFWMLPNQMLNSNNTTVLKCRGFNFINDCKLTKNGKALQANGR